MNQESLRRLFLLLSRKREKFCKKVTVDQDLCLGCILCIKTAPNVFTLDKNGKACVASEVDERNLDAVQEAICFCPACAIRKL